MARKLIFVRVDGEHTMHVNLNVHILEEDRKSYIREDFEGPLRGEKLLRDRLNRTAHGQEVNLLLKIVN